MIVVIDYGMGNLKSVGNALKKLNIDYKISGDVEVIREADGLILPGVGAFKDAIKNLESLIPIIKQKVALGYPLLGICLGMQMLFERSYEGGNTRGLGFLKGSVKLLEPKESVKIPHIGWNNLIGDCPLVCPYVYFVHSYYATEIDEKDMVAYVEYGKIKVPAYVNKGKVWGAQFHPEKSGDSGLEILKKFGELVK